MQQLGVVVEQLRNYATSKRFNTAAEFEAAARHLSESCFLPYKPEPQKAQSFPDIVIANFGIEVKFCLQDSWRSVANSILESSRHDNVEEIFILFCKMGGRPDVRFAPYADSIVHVRTSHVPRFEVEIGAERSIFAQFGISYSQFTSLELAKKMTLVRDYARSRLVAGERLWWLEDPNHGQHSLPLQARLYTHLSETERRRLRAEVVLLCPAVLGSGRRRNKYDDAALFMLTYHGVLSHQTRDLFSAGSVANPRNDDAGGLYIERAILLIEEEIAIAAVQVPDSLLMEYWGCAPPVVDRLTEWLRRADAAAEGWVPSLVLFREPED